MVFVAEKRSRYLFDLHMRILRKGGRKDGRIIIKVFFVLKVF